MLRGNSPTAANVTPSAGGASHEMSFSVPRAATPDGSATFTAPANVIVAGCTKGAVFADRSSVAPDARTVLVVPPTVTRPERILPTVSVPTVESTAPSPQIVPTSPETPDVNVAPFLTSISVFPSVSAVVYPLAVNVSTEPSRISSVPPPPKTMFAM